MSVVLQMKQNKFCAFDIFWSARALTARRVFVQCKHNQLGPMHSNKPVTGKFTNLPPRQAISFLHLLQFSKSDLYFSPVPHKIFIHTF